MPPAFRRAPQVGGRLDDLGAPWVLGAVLLGAWQDAQKDAWMFVKLRDIAVPVMDSCHA